MKLFQAILMVIWCISASAANILENSSFECGDLRGWSYEAYSSYPNMANDTGAATPLCFSNLWTYHGQHSFSDEVVLNKQVRLVSRYYRLKPGTNYTVSVWAKGQGASLALVGGTMGIYNSVEGGSLYFSSWIPADTNWNRYTITFPTTNVDDLCSYSVKLGVNGSGGPAGDFVYFDAVQLEEGSSATTYAPLSAVEMGCNMDRATPAHIYYPDETPAVHVTTFNNTTLPSTNTLTWRVFGWSHDQRTNGTTTITCGTNASVTNIISIAMPGTKTNGWFRFLGWMTGTNGSAIETCFGVIPRPVVIPNRTNGMFGSECYPSPWYLSSFQRMGLHWNRNLSVHQWGRWTVANPTPGVWVEATNLVSRNRTYDVEPLAQIGNGQNLDGIPVWAQNTNNSNWPSNYLWSNFVFTIVTDYKPYVTYWELWNEAVYGGSESTFAPQYTNILIWGSDAVRLADPASVVVAPADFFYLAISNMLHTAIGRSNHIDRWTTHMYSSSGLSFTAPTVTTAAHFNKEVWNGETGGRIDTGHELVPWELARETAVNPFGGGWTRHRDKRLPQQCGNLWSCIGSGMRNYLYYEARCTGGHDGYISFSLFDYSNVVGPMGVMMGCSANLLEGATGLGRNDLHPDAVSYACSRSNQVLFALFFGAMDAETPPLTTTNMAVTTSSSTVEMLDMFGNLLSLGVATNTFGRDPIIVRGPSGMSSNTLATSLTLWRTNDTASPTLALVDWMLGTNNSRFTFRWAGMDDCGLNTRDTLTTNAIQYAYKVDGVDSGYSAWTNVTYVTYTNLNPATSYRFTVKAKDAAGNESAAVSSSADVASGVGTLNVSSNLNVGTLIIAP